MSLSVFWQNVAKEKREFRNYSENEFLVKQIEKSLNSNSCHDFPGKGRELL